MNQIDSTQRATRGPQSEPSITQDAQSPEDRSNRKDYVYASITGALIGVGLWIAMTLWFTVINHGVLTIKNHVIGLSFVTLVGAWFGFCFAHNLILLEIRNRKPTDSGLPKKQREHPE